MPTHFAVKLTLLLLLAPFAGAWAEDDPYQETVEIFKEAGESGNMFEVAYGYAVFPTVGRAGIGIGGAHGRGRAFVNGKHVGDTTMTQVTVGFQLGAQGYRMIIFFEDERAFTEFTSGNFEFSATASAVAITAGASAAATTTGSSAGASGGKNDALSLIHI